jgi:catalase
VSDDGAKELARDSAVVGFVADAFNHLKIIGHVPAAAPLLRRAGVSEDLADEGLVPLRDSGSVAKFIATAKKMRVWAREPKVRNIL